MPSKIVVKLAYGKARKIQSMVQTTFWDPSGKPMSATEFLESLFGALPECFKDEDELRAIWSLPETRKPSGRSRMLRFRRLARMTRFSTREDRETTRLRTCATPREAHRSSKKS